MGVDGSLGARAALVQALLEAGHRGADLDVVAAYTMELIWFGGAPLALPDVVAVRENTRAGHSTSSRRLGAIGRCRMRWTLWRSPSDWNW